ncbi:MAG: ChbG/HpnK family deacetylase [Lachnospiraceae bacterium]|nr:ChbG/HpnK family deacetylase [Lachnospiraceae bacterium]MDE7031274.1 ChbG/HpnK family deacetylase [Lachnospiraceae bacterium]
MGNKIWFHADDFGVTVEQSKRILNCYQDGVLNSISVLPNTPVLETALELLNQADPDGTRIRRVLHLNFVEGRPLAGAENVPDLVDSTGYFNKSFLQFFCWNYTKRGRARQQLVSQIKREIAAQLYAVTCAHDYQITAIDSHQHYHMIPLVFDSLMEVLRESAQKPLPLRQIRVPVDPAAALWHSAPMRRGVPPLNWVKWCILNLFAERTKKVLQGRGVEAPVFFGIFYTCQMKWEVVEALLPSYKAYADKKDMDLELMFHPGSLAARYELLDERNEALADFYMSDNRYYEAECLKLLNQKLS